MNRNTARSLLFLTLLSTALFSTRAAAEDLYQITWRGLAYGTNTAGRIIVRQFTEAVFINQVAADNVISTKGLVLVYRPDKRDAAVVRASDGTFIANAFQMEFVYTDVSDATHQTTIRQAFIHDEQQEGPLGSAFGIERTRLSTTTGARLSYSFSGSFNYSRAYNGMIYRGSFMTVRKIKDLAPPSDA